MIRNIIFDWSGTLVDDLPAVLQATNHVLRMAGRSEMTREQFRAEFCLPFTIFYDRYVPHVALPQLERWFHGCFQQVQDSVIALPYARDFLEFCRARGVRTFVLSTVRRDHFLQQAARAGFTGYFRRVYAGVTDKRLKIRSMLKENRLEAADTMFIGDMQHDIEAARVGGVQACAVLTGYNSVAQLRTSAPDLMVEHLGELRHILERNGMALTPASAPTATRADTPTPLVTVGALIFNAAGQVLMLRTHKWSDLWGIPGGKVKWGEPAVAALRREILEETNLAVAGLQFVLVQDCIHSKEFYRDAHFVLLNYTCRVTGAPEVKLNEEAREFRWVSPAQALRMPLNTPTRILVRAVRAKAKSQTHTGHPAPPTRRRRHG